MFSAEASSYRDPSGHVFYDANSVLRSVTEHGRAAYEGFRSNKQVAKLVEAKKLIGFEEIPRAEWPQGFQDDTAYLLRHPKIDFISYPYEWPFAALKRAALFHLDLHMELLKGGLTLSDASAYNVQFRGSQPIFIDLLSIRPYKEGEYWDGYDQFLRQFFNPLMLEARCGFPFSALYRGQLEGIPSKQLADLLPASSRFSLSAWMHVLLPAKLERSQLTSPKNATDKEKLDRKKLPKSAFLNILGSLRRAVEKIEPRRKKTVWSGYANDNSYSDKTREEKHAFVGDFVKRTSPNVLIDLGCNDGEYSFLSCENGAGHVVGFELDREATDRAFTQSHAKKAPYLPLIVDIANPSPSQGWLNQERTTLKSRLKSDALIALAVIHHLVIGRNLPIRQVVEELMALAPKGVIEFVPKGDPMVDLMLLNREDIFPDYTFETFKSAIEANGVIKRQMKLSDSTRTFIEYAR